MTKELACYKSSIGILKIELHDDQLYGIGLVTSMPSRPKLTPSSSMRTFFCELDEYFGGRRINFSIARVARGTDFQRAVWDELAAIPFGQTKSYGEIAAGIGRPQAMRAVGGACGRNPYLIVVPCHRVLAARGRIGGFTGGLDIKRRLLCHEGIHFS